MAFRLMDAHQHAWDRSLFNYPWLIDRPDLPACAMPDDNTGLDFILVEAGVAPLHRAAEARWLVQIASHCPSILGIVAAEDWAFPDFKRISELGATSSVVGIRLTFGDALPTRTNAKRLARTLKAARGSGLTVDVLTRLGGLRLLGKALEIESEASVVIDHLGSAPWGSSHNDIDHRQWRDALSNVSSARGVSAKLSGFSMREPTRYGPQAVVESAYEIFGDSGLMFGSDWPVSDFSSLPTRGASWFNLISNALPGCQTSGIQGETAVRVYGLKV